MKTISKETAIFIGIAGGIVFLIGILLAFGASANLILPTLFFSGIILLAIGLLLSGSKRSND